jgi:hypothetical protein
MAGSKDWDQRSKSVSERPCRRGESGCSQARAASEGAGGGTAFGASARDFAMRATKN